MQGSSAPAPARDALIVVAIKAIVSVGVLASGFRAISDDDYARVVIAQRFAVEPMLDPSGTSWLPAPFWLNGLLMLPFGRSLDVARGTAFALGLLSAALVHVAARWLGLSRARALAAALMAAFIPYAARLGVATVPEAPTAALIVLGAAAIASDEPRRKALGGLAILLATLSRYESWPVAAGFSALTAWDAARRRSPALFGIALIPLAGPIFWMVGGALHHGDALFFTARVAAYRDAVSGASAPLLSRLVSYPLCIVRYEPELMLLAGLAITGALACRASLRRHRRSGALLGLMLAFLVLGEGSGAAATHHPERAVLSIWFWAAIVVPDFLPVLFGRLPRRARPRLALVTAAVILAGVVIRLSFGRIEPFSNRSLEVAIGRDARRLVPEGQRLSIDSADFGFYAVTAAFGRPEQAEPLDDRDPRRPRPADPFVSDRALESRLSATGAGWLVARAEHAELVRGLGRPVALNPGFLLVELGKPRGSVAR